MPLIRGTSSTDGRDPWSPSKPARPSPTACSTRRSAAPCSSAPARKSTPEWWWGRPAGAKTSRWTCARESSWPTPALPGRTKPFGWCRPGFCPWSSAWISSTRTSCWKSRPTICGSGRKSWIPHCASGRRWRNERISPSYGIRGIGSADGRPGCVKSLFLFRGESSPRFFIICALFRFRAQILFGFGFFNEHKNSTFLWLFFQDNLRQRTDDDTASDSMTQILRLPDNRCLHGCIYFIKYCR